MNKSQWFPITEVKFNLDRIQSNIQIFQNCFPLLGIYFMVQSEDKISQTHKIEVLVIGE